MTDATKIIKTGRENVSKIIGTGQANIGNIMGVGVVSPPAPPVPPGPPWVLDETADLYAGTTQDGLSTIAPLNDGNVMVGYAKGNQTNPFAIKVFDPSLNVVVSEIEIRSSGVTKPEMITLQGGNVVIAFRDADDSNIGKYGIYTPSGSVVTAFTAFGAMPSYKIALSPRSDGGFFIFYASGANTLESVVYDSEGNEIYRKDEGLLFNGGRLDATPLSSDGAAVAFINNTNDHVGYLKVNSTGLVVFTNTDISVGAAENMYITELQNGDFFFDWYDFWGTSKTYRSIRSSVDAVVLASTEQLGAPDLHRGCITLSNGDVCVFVGTAWKLWIYQEDGTYIEDTSTGDFIYGGSGGLQVSRVVQLTGGEISCINDGLYSCDLNSKRNVAAGCSYWADGPKLMGSCSRCGKCCSALWTDVFGKGRKFEGDPCEYLMKVKE